MKWTEFFLVFLIIALCGCSTVGSLSPEFRNNLRGNSEVSKRWSKCNLPSIYSGVALTYCIKTKDVPADDIGIILFLDLPFSFVADTLVLPYTIVDQIMNGNIVEKKK